MKKKMQIQLMLQLEWQKRNKTALIFRNEWLGSAYVGSLPAHNYFSQEVVVILPQ